MKIDIHEIDQIQEELKNIEHPGINDILNNIIKEIRYYQNRTTNKDKFIAYELAIEIIKDRIIEAKNSDLLV